MESSQDTDKSQAEAGSSAAGQRLRAARESRGLTVNEVALKLRLDRTIVLALESGDYASLGAPVFVRGYLRSYARLLDLPEAEIAAAYATEEIEPEEFKTRSMTTELKAGANVVSFLMWVVLAVIVLVGALYVLIDDAPEPEADGKGEFVTPRPAEEVGDASSVAPRESRVPGRFATEPVAAPAPAIAAEPVISPAPEAPAMTSAPETVAEVEQPAAPEPALPAEVILVLTFNDECWAEVSDSRRRLIYGLEKAGRSRTVSGIPPFKLFLGNVNAVDLTVNGTPYDMRRRTRSGSNTARFSLAVADIEGLKE